MKQLRNVRHPCNCKQPNPRIEIDRICRETEYLSTKGKELRQDLLTAIQQLKALPASSEQLHARAATESDLKSRVRALQKQMTRVSENLRKVESNVHIDNHSHLVAELPALHNDLREAGKHLNMWAWYTAERESQAEGKWLDTRRWYWVESREARPVEDEDRARVAEKSPLIGEVVAEGVTVGTEMDELD
ncbi:hypothetical protein B0A55_04366 [Friedmanniomyces simplex]|uniref:Uncharacterized protein n=1 Tax=Friedmanniomyces simplex TaxID=329884 RepID=A0A4V5NHN3_9PEZI|nr:hypothetical protein B0A55_04366 [Friedmanniomyces simplex]